MRAVMFSALLMALVGPSAHAAEISVTYSAEFLEKLEDDYGVKEGEVLADTIRQDIARELGRSQAAPARIEVTILDARPSRPTFKQAGDQPGLDMFRSVSTGGMDLEAVAYADDGTPAGDLRYKWYETDIRNAGLTTWHDASRASDRFARRFIAALGTD